jgi:hypothetical protein
MFSAIRSLLGAGFPVMPPAFALSLLRSEQRQRRSTKELGTPGKWVSSFGYVQSRKKKRLPNQEPLLSLGRILVAVTVVVSATDNRPFGAMLTVLDHNHSAMIAVAMHTMMFAPFLDNHFTFLGLRRRGERQSQTEGGDCRKG